MKRFIPLIILLTAISAYAEFGLFGSGGMGLNGGAGKWVDLKPTLSRSPASHAFGNVSTASKRRTTFALTNSGNATLTELSFGTFSSAAFRNATSASSPCGASLAAKASCNKDVEFGPAAAKSPAG